MYRIDRYWGEQNLTVPDILRADLFLRRPASAPPCSYNVAPTGFYDVGSSSTQLTMTLRRTSGDCAWQATTNVNWFTLSPASGSGDATMTVSYPANPGYIDRAGVVTVEWSGGSAQLTIRQEMKWCTTNLTVGGQSTIDVPAAGAQYFAAVAFGPGVPADACQSSWTASANGPISFVGATSGGVPGGVTFAVAPNPSATARSMSVTVNFGMPTLPAVLTLNQAGAR